MSIQIALVNTSSLISDADAGLVAAALAVQLQRDFEPAWGIHAQITLTLRGHDSFPGSWQLQIMDTPDRAGASGYHSLTPEGQPLGKVFLTSAGGFDPNWSVAASHELLEMLADPRSNRVMSTPDGDSVTLYALEVCDPCEAVSYAYAIGGIKVSDFVYPDWFDPTAPNNTLLDYTGSVRAPLELLPGGFISQLKVPGEATWQTTFGPTAADQFGTQASRPFACRHIRHERAGGRSA